MQKTFTVSTSVSVFEKLSDLTATEMALLVEAGKALLGAYAPYSGFKVGAAVMLEGGEIVVGNNQENAAYPSGLCAERVALFAARAVHPNKKILALAVQASSGDTDVNIPVSPCGSCRQVMAEYEFNQNTDFPVLLSGATGPIYRFNSANDLLPLAFQGGFLKKK